MNDSILLNGGSIEAQIQKPSNTHLQEKPLKEGINNAK